MRGHIEVRHFHMYPFNTVLGYQSLPCHMFVFTFFGAYNPPDMGMSSLGRIFR